MRTYAETTACRRDTRDRVIMSTVASNPMLATDDGDDGAPPPPPLPPADDGGDGGAPPLPEGVGVEGGAPDVLVTNPLVRSVPFLPRRPKRGLIPSRFPCSPLRVSHRRGESAAEARPARRRRSTTSWTRASAASCRRRSRANAGRRGACSSARTGSPGTIRPSRRSSARSEGRLAHTHSLQTASAGDCYQPRSRKCPKPAGPVGLPARLQDPRRAAEDGPGP